MGGSSASQVGASSAPMDKLQAQLHAIITVHDGRLLDCLKCATPPCHL